MKPTNNSCPSHAIVYRRLATSASPMRNIFSTKFSLKRDSAGENMSILLHDIYRQIRDHDPTHTIHDLWLSLPCRFHALYSFPHIFWFLHQNRAGIGGFTLTKHRSVGDEQKIIPSCLDTSSLMIAPPVLPQSAFCALKKKIGRS